MTLNTRIGRALDDALAATPGFEGFERLKARGPELRLWFRQTPDLQCEILFHRDKWWTREGGRLYADIRCLPSTLQLAVAGRPQSLANPDYALRIASFQYGTEPDEVQRDWAVDPGTDMEAFAAAIGMWLANVAAPWIAEWDGEERVIARLSRRPDWPDLSLLLAHLGRTQAAQQAWRDWLATLPRRIEPHLPRMRELGLLDPKDEPELLRAAMQSEDDYRDWVQRRQGAPP